jgi:RNA polymerase sigma factor (sigma-70 family)
MIEKVFGSNNEEELWRAFQEGDEAAFARLYQLYADTLFGYCIRFTNDRDLIKDCIHDLFVELWKSRRTVSATTSVRFYLLACIKRKVLRHLQKSQLVTTDGPVTASQSATASYESDMIQEQDWQQTQEGLQQALTCLTKRQREAIFLKYYQNLPYEQIADLMGVNAQSVYNLVFGALRVMKKSLRLEKVIFTLSCLLTQA